MTASLRSLVVGFGLGVALVAGSSVFAAPLPKLSGGPTKLPMGPTKLTTSPTQKLVVSPKTGLTGGLTGRATLTPRALFNKGASMNVHRAPRVEATSNKVKMDKNTQLWIYFRAAKNTEYDISCQFSGQRTIVTMDYAGGKYVRQQSTTPTNSGRLDHKVYARPKVENIKVYMQATGNIDWSRCTVEPAN